jgi:hypothetical protein
MSIDGSIDLKSFKKRKNSSPLSFLRSLLDEAMLTGQEATTRAVSERGEDKLLLAQ